MSDTLDLLRNDFLPDRNGVDRASCVAIGLALAFEWPEWARAYYEMFDATGDAKEQSLAILRGFIERNPIEATR